MVRDPVREVAIPIPGNPDSDSDLSCVSKGACV